MKFCPICKTRYDEEILRFCTKDGTPLIEEGEPHFTALPSESNPDDLGEETVVRRKTPPAAPDTAQLVPDFETESERLSSPRIVIPMTGETGEQPEEPRKEAVRASTTPSIRRQPPVQKSNTAMIVFLTVLGTVVILAGATGIFWFLSNQNSGANQNTNYNTNFNSIDVNLNTNLDVANSLVNFNSGNSSSNNSNANTNTDTNANTNVSTNVSVNVNANLRTPILTRTPIPTPTPSEDENENTNSTTNTNSSTPPINTRPPLPRPTPTVTPRSLPTPPPPPATNRPDNTSVLN